MPLPTGWDKGAGSRGNSRHLEVKDTRIKYTGIRACLARHLCLSPLPGWPDSHEQHMTPLHAPSLCPSLHHHIEKSSPHLKLPEEYHFSVPCSVPCSLPIHFLYLFVQAPGALTRMRRACEQTHLCLPHCPSTTSRWRWSARAEKGTCSFPVCLAWCLCGSGCWPSLCALCG